MAMAKQRKPEALGAENGVQKGGSTTAPMPGGQTQSQPGQPSSFAQSNFASSKAILDRNRGEAANQAAANRVVNPAAQEYGQNQAALQNEYKSYADTQAKKLAEQKAPSAGQVENYLQTGGKEGDQQAIAGALSGKPIDVEAANFAPVKDLSAGKYLRQGDISSLLRQGAKGSYTTGMGNIDNMIFNRSNAANNVQNIIRGMNAQAVRGKEQLQGEATGKAKLAAEQKANEARTGVQGILDQLEKGLIGKNEAANLAGTQQRTQKAEQLTAEQRKKGENILKEAMGKYSGITGKDIPGLKDIDINKYLTAAQAGPALSGYQGLDRGGLDMLNRIYGLENKAPVSADSLQDVGPAAFDEDRLRGDIGALWDKFNEQSLATNPTINYKTGEIGENISDYAKQTPTTPITGPANSIKGILGPTDINWSPSGGGIIPDPRGPSNVISENISDYANQKPVKPVVAPANSQKKLDLTKLMSMGGGLG